MMARVPEWIAGPVAPSNSPAPARLDSDVLKTLLLSFADALVAEIAGEG
jgi:hypothetical protein